MAESIASVGAFSTKAGELFIDAPPSPEILARQERDDLAPTIKRSRYVRVDFDLLRNSEPPPEPPHSSGARRSVALNLFADVSFITVNDRIEMRSSSRYTWYGHIQEVERSQVILVIENGSLAGSIMTPGEQYQIRDIGGGVHAIYEIDQSALPPHADPIPVP